jgi:hypothetical protein
MAVLTVHGPTLKLKSFERPNPSLGQEVSVIYRLSRKMAPMDSGEYGKPNASFFGFLGA